MKGKKHFKNAETVQCFFRPIKKANDNNEISTAHIPNLSQIQRNKSRETKQLTLTFVSKSSPSEKKAEILFALKSIVSNWPANSIRSMNQLFQCMFTDSEIAKGFQLSHTKLKYITNFGIAPYFHQLLIDELENCNYYSLSFDESLNDFTQTCQMDINIRFWSKAKKKARVSYFDSKFLGQAKPNELLASSNEIINTINSGNKVIQISMDGPSTNWKFFELVQKDKEEKEQKKLLDIASCSLYIIHGAFKSGAEKNGLDIKSIFKAAYTILHDTPA